MNIIQYPILRAGPVGDELELPLARQALSRSNLADVVEKVRPVSLAFPAGIFNAEEDESTRESSERRALAVGRRRREHALASGVVYHFQPALPSFARRRKVRVIVWKSELQV